MGYFVCPYCDKSNEEPDDCNEQDVNYEHECEHCGKNFVFTIWYERNYSEEKADCLNGGEHNYEKICGCPEEAFKNKRRCSMCDKVINVKEEVRETNNSGNHIQKQRDVSNLPKAETSFIHSASDSIRSPKQRSKK